MVISKLKFAALGLALMLLLGACDTIHGPGLKNGSNEPFKATVYFVGGGNSTFELKPGKSFGQLNQSREFDKIMVIQDSKQTVYDANVIRPLLAQVPSSSDAMFVVGPDGLKITTFQESTNSR